MYCIQSHCITSTRWLEFSNVEVLAYVQHTLASYERVSAMSAPWRSNVMRLYAVHCDAVWCSVLQCVAVCCSVLLCVAVCCSVLQCVAVCCSVLQCVYDCMQRPSSGTVYNHTVLSLRVDKNSQMSDFKYMYSIQPHRMSTSAHVQNTVV